MAKGFDEFPLWLNDWRGSTARAEMNLAERGAYLELLTWQFSLGGKGVDGVPRDDRAIARLLGVTVEEWREVKPAVLARFEVKGGRLVNGKVEKELRYKRTRVAGGKARAQGARDSAGRFAGKDAGQQLDRNTDHPSSSSSSSSSDDETTTTDDGSARARALERIRALRNRARIENELEQDFTPIGEVIDGLGPDEGRRSGADGALHE